MSVQQLGTRVRAGEAITGAELAGFDGPFVASALGLVWDEIRSDAAHAHVDIDERHHQPFGVVHGGVWCAIVETVASVAGLINVAADGNAVVGVHNATDFLRTHRHGRVDVYGEPVHLGRTQQLWQVRITRAEDDKPVALGQVRLQVIDGMPAPKDTS